MSYLSTGTHYVFSTKGRQPIITGRLREALWPFIGGLALHYKIKPLEIGGMADHLHLLLFLPATLSTADAMNLIKGKSSRWINKTFPEYRHFEWQKKYGAFHISESQMETVQNYIRNQEQHHKERTFEEEFLLLLKQHRIAYDEKYLWE